MKNKILAIILAFVAVLGIYATTYAYDPIAFEPEIIDGCTHTYNSFLNPTSDYRYSYATCTAAARYYKKCTKCGEMAPKTYANTFEVGYSLGHDYEDATCTKPKTCSRCGGTSGNALGHTSTTWKSVDDGVNNLSHYRECERCGKYDEGAHTVSSWTLATTAINGRIDYHTGICTECGLTAREECNSNGVKVHTNPDSVHLLYCTKCDRNIRYEGHDYIGGDGTSAEDVHHCSKCQHKHSTISYHYYPQINAGENLSATLTCGLFNCGRQITLEGSFKDLTGLIIEDYVAADAHIAMDPVPEIEAQKYALQWEYTESPKVTPVLRATAGGGVVDAPDLPKSWVTLEGWNRKTIKQHMEGAVEWLRENSDLARQDVDVLLGEDEIPEDYEYSVLTPQLVTLTLDKLTNDPNLSFFDRLEYAIILGIVEDGFSYTEDEFNIVLNISKSVLGTQEAQDIVSQPPIDMSEKEARYWDPGISQSISSVINEGGLFTADVNISGVSYEIDFSDLTNGGWYFQNYPFAAGSTFGAELFRNGELPPPPSDPWYANIYYTYRTKDNEVPKNGYYGIYGHGSVCVYDRGPINATARIPADLDLIDRTGYRYLGYKVQVGPSATASKYSSDLNKSTVAEASVGWDVNRGAAYVTFFVEPVELTYGHKVTDVTGKIMNVKASSHENIDGLEFPDYFDDELNQSIVPAGDNFSADDIEPLESLHKFYFPGYILKSSKVFEAGTSLNGNKITDSAVKNKVISGSETIYTDDTTTNIDGNPPRYVVNERVPSFYESEERGFAKDKDFYYFYTTPTILVEHKSYDDPSKFMQTLDSDPKDIKYTQQIINQYAYIESLVTDNVKDTYTLRASVASGDTLSFTYKLPMYDLVQIKIYEVKENNDLVQYATLYADDKYADARYGIKIEEYSGVFEDYYAESLDVIAQQVGKSTEVFNTNKNWKVEFIYEQVERVYIKFKDLQGNNIFIENPAKSGEYVGELTYRIPEYKNPENPGGYTYIAKDLGENGRYTLVKYTKDSEKYVTDLNQAKPISNNKPVTVGLEREERNKNWYLIFYYTRDKILTVDYRDLNGNTLQETQHFELPTTGAVVEVPTFDLHEVKYYKHNDNYDSTIAENLATYKEIVITTDDKEIAVSNPNETNQHIIIYYEGKAAVRVDYRDLNGNPLVVPSRYVSTEKIEIPSTGTKIEVPQIPGYEVRYYLKNEDYNGTDNEITGNQNSIPDTQTIPVISNGKNQFIIIYYEKVVPTTKLTIYFREDTPTGPELKPSVTIEIPNGDPTNVTVPEIEEYIPKSYVPNSGTETTIPEGTTPTITVVGDPEIGDQTLIIIYTKYQEADLLIEYREGSVNGPEIAPSVGMDLATGETKQVEVPEILSYVVKYYVKNEGGEVTTVAGNKINITGMADKPKQKIIIVYELLGETTYTPDDNIERVYLKANHQGAEEYNVEAAVPTSEDLYVTGDVYSYRFVSKLEEKEYTKPIKVELIQEYYRDMDDLTDIGTLTTGVLDFDITYNYYDILKAELYDLQGLTLKNAAIKYYDPVNGFKEGEANYPVNDGTPKIEYSIPEDKIAIGDPNARIQIHSASGYIVSYDPSSNKCTIKATDKDYYERSETDAIKNQMKTEALAILEKCIEIKIQSLAITKDGADPVVILTGANYALPERGEILKSPDYYKEYTPGRTPLYNFTHNKDLYVREAAENRMYTTTMQGDYRLVSEILAGATTVNETPEVRKLIVDEINVNSLNVHTPIIIGDTKLTPTGDNKDVTQVNQTIKTDLDNASVTVLNLEEKFEIVIPNNGVHSTYNSATKEYNNKGLTLPWQKSGVTYEETTDDSGKRVSNKSLDALMPGGIIENLAAGTVINQTALAAYETEQDSMGPAFAEYKLIRFPFDVYLLEPDASLATNGPVLFKANEWYNLYQYVKPSETTYNFALPIWVKDATLYSDANAIHVLVVAENAPLVEIEKAMTNPLNVSDADNNVNSKNVRYILRKTFNVYVSGRVYDLQIRDTDDPGYMGKLQNALKGDPSMPNSVTEMPIAQPGQVKGYNMGLKLGYRIYFDLKTKGISNQTITIKPKIYYVSRDGSNVTTDISLFYHSKGSMYNRLDTNDLNIRMIMAGTHGLAGKNSGFTAETIAAKQISPSRVFTNQSIIGKVFSSLTLKRDTEKLPYNNVIDVMIACGFDPDDPLNVQAFNNSIAVSEYVNTENDIKNATGHWYGEYYLPASTIVVRGASATKQDAMNPANVITNGYLVVVFEEITTEDDVTPTGGYLTYDAPVGSSQWSDEGIDRFVVLPGTGAGPEIKVPADGTKEGAPMAIYQVGLRANNDYETEGTH